MTTETPTLDVQVEDTGPCSKKLRIKVPASRVDHEIDETYKNVIRSVQFPGFRPGKAPRKLVEARMGDRVLAEVKQRLVETALDEAIRDQDLKPVGQGQLEWDSITLEKGAELAFDVTVDVRPEFDLPDLTELTVKRPDLSIGDEDVEQQLETLRGGQAKVEPADEDEALAELGIAALAVTVTVDGESIVEGAETEWRHPAEVLGGMAVPGLPEALLGKKKGEDVELALDLPDDFRDEEHRGKEATLSMTVGEIQRVTLPDLDDEFAQAMDYDDLQELRDETRKQLERRLEGAREDALDQAVVDALVDAVPFEVPPSMLEAETDRMLQRYEARLRQEGMEENEIPKLLTGARDEASGRVSRELRASFVLDRIGSDRKVLVTESEVHQELANMAGRYNRTVAEMEEYMERQGLMSSMRSTLRERKTLRELRDVLTIEDAATADAGSETPDEETTA